VQEEEQTTLPQLSAVLDVETQLRLGILFEAAKVREGAETQHVCHKYTCYAYKVVPCSWPAMLLLLLLLRRQRLLSNDDCASKHALLC
jgi:hypothetical protein